MKKLLLLFLLSAASFTVKAQKMSFEETVNYLNILLSKGEQYDLSYSALDKKRMMTKGLDAKKNGEVTIHTFKGDYKFYLLDVKEIYLGTTAGGGHYTVGLLNKSDISIGFLIFGVANTPEPVPNRVKNALEHLRSLCIPEKDPFDK